MYNMHGEEDQCVYYDLAIAVNSLKGLAETLSCTHNEVVRDMPNLVDELPSVVKSSDLDFSMKGLYKLNYPNDFRQLAFRNNGKRSKNGSKQMVMTTMIDTQDPFIFSSNIAFDMPIAGMSMRLVEYSGDAEGDTELIARQSPL